MSERETLAEARARRHNQTMHAWFINGELSGAAMHDGPVREVGPAVIAEANSHDGTVLHGTTRTWPLGEQDWPVELVYEGTVKLHDGYVAEWRHVFRRPDEPWPLAALSAHLATTRDGDTSGEDGL